MGGKFNERAFLIRALMGIFILQFATVGYQTFSCQSAVQSGKDSDKVTLICNNAANSFNETGKLALTTFLALLVPSASQGAVEAIQTTGKRRKSTTEPKKEAEPDPSA
jgi:hypothetical protein